MKREIIKIDEELCNGCGLCVPNCHEGALQIIDGKARLISDLMCDGLGACVGHCPEGAITIEKREAAPYDEVAVIKEMIPKGKNVIIAHLKHLKEHGEYGFLKQGVKYLEENSNKLGFDLNEVKHSVHNSEKEVLVKEHIHEGGCPGAASKSFKPRGNNGELNEGLSLKSELRQWPVQMHLINPNAPYFKEADLLLSADCVSYALGNFHQKYLRNKILAIACPKLDSNMDVYVEKLSLLIDQAKVNTITVMMMEVPCCSGLVQLVQQAAAKSTRKVPIKSIIVGIQGDIITESWV